VALDMNNARLQLGDPQVPFDFSVSRSSWHGVCIAPNIRVKGQKGAVYSV